MPPKNSKRKYLKKLYSFPVFLLLVILIVTTLRGVYSSYYKYKREDNRVEKAKEDLAAMKNREDKLREENEWLKTNRGQEELFREQYMIAKEGENVMVITNDKDSELDHTITTETKENAIISKTKKIIGVE